MEGLIILITVFGVWIVSRLGDIREELGRIRRLLVKAEEGEA